MKKVVKKKEGRKIMLAGKIGKGIQASEAAKVAVTKI